MRRFDMKDMATNNKVNKSVFRIALSPAELRYRQQKCEYCPLCLWEGLVAGLSVSWYFPCRTHQHNFLLVLWPLQVSSLVLLLLCLVMPI